MSSNMWNAALVQSSADSIIGMSKDGVIQSWNEASSRLYGYSATEALDQDAPSFLARDPAERKRLVAKVAAGDEQSQIESQDLSKDGGVIDVSVTDSPIRDAEGLVVGVSRIARDIGARKRMERELQYLAAHDWLTGLYNRRRLIPELDSCLGYAARYGHAGAVLVLDIDNFKLVNDSEGHEAGDRTLKAVAEVLVSRTRDTDLLARLGGDEFAIVLPEATEQGALKVASNVRSLLCERPSRPIKVSVGISLFTPEQKLTADDALVAADVAQYEAKEHGGDQACVFSGRAAGTLTQVERIRVALAEDRFVLYGQPIVDLRSGLVAYHELLIRMHSDDGGSSRPAIGHHRGESGSRPVAWRDSDPKRSRASRQDEVENSTVSIPSCNATCASNPSRNTSSIARFSGSTSATKCVMPRSCATAPIRCMRIVPRPRPCR
jgi:diguanylate cyclase (GGDEF)-like protein/PAS domain S-box-containing protein